VVNTTKLGGSRSDSDGGWAGVGLSAVAAFSDGVVVVTESFDDAWVGAVSAFDVVFEDFIDSFSEGFSAVVRGKSRPGW
jgi:hypothetical protein